MRSKEIPPNLNEDQIKFWLANTDLTKEELVKWYSEFYEYARANSGGLDKDSFIKFFSKLRHKKKNSDDFFKLAFNAFDKDNSGTVDFPEFIVAFNIISNGDLKKRLEWMFEVYDLNNDKIIDRQEIQTIVKAVLKMSKKKLVGDQTDETKINELFENLDNNENNKITEDEFVENCMNNVFMREILSPDI
ncbi:neuronal calcium sensor 2-like [Brachionus plicatilis]|uniref:Neuronal calcium sensor 2-like n=1 Tax=Brachionus plicatilis TaxID=10195 RepID=A0A3M7QVU2_BRAPC|nr:neuronal calcium sensor 2-like [Brachionus plicatilis]